ncbi:hypothetical protein QJS04_geneDACA015493 [Acorus gramineus]|uniref:Uncharacterized protein n=1 Tax=Acorus gramineus TaxID=55184 RepID=A0AAV9A534_ACOGR|nr:hypothetical protein QJS04_geneDACA015493 [Acorus gramineus]
MNIIFRIMDDLYRVTFIYGGYWKVVKSRNGQNYVKGKQLTKMLDRDKIAMIDLWDDFPE